MALSVVHGEENSQPHRFSGVWDKLGIFASALCLVDCIVLPITSTILISIQTSAAWAAAMHGWLLLVIGLSASMAFYHSFRAHRAYGIVATGVTGFLLLLAGDVFEARALIQGINWVSLLGSALLIAAHLKNLWMHSAHSGHGHPH